ncbi:NEDD8 ultimate buster 1-like isoform X2 [Amblyraja radiata]|uniref:NEDD8 ultimate buster 1-like isoform X2 n=1 Tax=Amblyraja radiata TaxID=386614 RepID=UPI0014028E6E|nr:NEDD8 ultimate buster 1-like isoform X2 [Amblyraja radiata]
MAEGRQQEIEAVEMMVSPESVDVSSEDLLLSIQLPQQPQGKEKKIKIKISGDATGSHLCDEIMNRLQNTKRENVQLIFKGKNLNLNKTLSEQNVKNKGVIRFTQINQGERRQMDLTSRIMKGAEILAKRGEHFEEKYLNTTNHRVENIDLAEGEKVVFLTALILHEVARWNMKRKDYRQALMFLEYAENYFRQCSQELFNSVDNYGALNLDITWCYLQLQDIQRLVEARERLENAEKYFNQCFGKNQQRLKELEDRSGRHRILFLRLQVLWGVWFFLNQKLDQSREGFCKAEELLDQLLVDDLSVTELVHQGCTTREARLGLRASDGNIEEAKSYIEEKRQQKAAAQRRRETLHRPIGEGHSDDTCSERNGTSDQINQVAQINSNSSPAAGSQLQPPNGETSSPSSTPATSASTGAQSNREDDEILREILTYLPNDIDDYIDMSLEEEEVIVRQYKSNFH